MVAVVKTGLWSGLQTPNPISSTYRLPTGYGLPNSAISSPYTLQTNLVVYIPLPIANTTSFSGAYLYQTGNTAGQNARIGIYTDSSSGGPGTLVGDFGNVAALGSTGMHGATSTIIAPGPAMYWIALASSGNAATVAYMNAVSNSGATMIQTPPQFSELGSFSTFNVTAPNSPGAYNMVGAYSASFAFGALPSTATAPTTDVLFAVGGNGIGVPAVFLKVT